MILSCIQKRSLTILEWMRMGGGSRRRVLYSSSGVLYNSFLFFHLSLTRSAATTSTPRFREPSPLDSARLVFNPLRHRERAGERTNERRHRLGDNGSHQASGINYARLSPREKLRAGPKLELVATTKKKSCRRSILLDEFFVCGSRSKSGTDVPSDLSVSTLTFVFL